MKKQYPFSAYDKYLCLKPDMVLWVAFIFLLRPYVVLVLSVANRKDRMAMINLFYSDRYAMILAAIAAIPAVMVLYAFLKRKPDASDRIRSIWRNGRLLLLGSLILNVIIVFLPLILGAIRSLGMIDWGELALCAYIGYYLLREQRVRDTFADFPPPDADAK